MSFNVGEGYLSVFARPSGKALRQWRVPLQMAQVSGNTRNRQTTPIKTGDFLLACAGTLHDAQLICQSSGKALDNNAHLGRAPSAMDEGSSKSSGLAKR